MANQALKIRRRHLDEFFANAKSVFDSEKPEHGWVREIRKALGMSMEALAGRMGVIKQRVDRIEKDEVTKKVTLHTMQRAAEALECEFVYFLVPKSSLRGAIEKNAEALARDLANDVGVTMNLESQAISKESLTRLWKDLAHELTVKNDKRIWKKR